MFESLTEGMATAFRKLTGKRRLTDQNIEDGLRDVRKALLEADVNLKVVKGFIKTVKEKAVGEELIKDVRPGQQVVKIVHDELVSLMGPVEHELEAPASGPTIVMMAGLQGAGKTTTCAKLAHFLRTKKKMNPLLVAADLQRPAAVDQLKILGEQIDVPVYNEPSNPVKVCQNGVKLAKKDGHDVVILDTAGRLHVDEELMAELKRIVKKCKPQNIFLVCDSMTGQDAVNSAKEFNDMLELDGLILTKIDGDTRGGAALSIKAVTGKPIKYLGTGEKIEMIEEFHPDRLASRILGMGDVVGLVERAQEAMDATEAMSLQKKMLEDKWNLDDFLTQLRSIKKMGSLKSLLGMIPGVGSMLKGQEIDDGEIGQVEAMICSMTKEERKKPDIIDFSRRRRIAAGSGHNPADVQGLLKQFQQMRKMMRDFSRMGPGGLGSLFKGGGMGQMAQHVMSTGQLPKLKVPKAAKGQPGPSRQAILERRRKEKARKKKKFRRRKK